MKVYTVTIEDPDGQYPHVFKTKKKRDKFLHQAIVGGLVVELEEFREASDEEQASDQWESIRDLLEYIDAKQWDEAIEAYNDFKAAGYPWERIHAEQTTLKQ